MERQPRSSRQRTLERDSISLHGFTVGLCRAAGPLTLTYRGQDARPCTVQRRRQGPKASEPPAPTNISYSRDY